MKPRVLLLDCGLEYKKGESQTNIEITKQEDFTSVALVAAVFFVFVVAVVVFVVFVVAVAVVFVGVVIFVVVVVVSLLTWRWNSTRVGAPIHPTLMHCRRLLELEEEMIEGMCRDIIALKPDVVVTEKGVSDLAQHYLAKANISVLRRLRKSDNNRIAR